ncbi:hypothetical protein DPMN_180816 [Dreissena polymorpha]|uniref:Uncharacterized protein n=1 Tax=Dreissena polymorpha TaxID=45954 RepID=A0A9D4I366_DREPO|nr:hypothetical protein DPMN_180816 [Dreissena polymorpha]
MCHTSRDITSKGNITSGVISHLTYSSWSSAPTLNAAAPSLRKLRQQPASLRLLRQHRLYANYSSAPTLNAAAASVLTLRQQRLYAYCNNSVSTLTVAVASQRLLRQQLLHAFAAGASLR